MTEVEIKELNKAEDITRKEILGDFTNNILIEALAGAGKTTILVDRLLTQIKEIEPSGIVAITFTEKAADELKARFQKGLLEAYALSAGEEKNKLKKAVDQIDDIQISTIHSFCNKLLKEMTFEAGLGLDFEVIRDAKEELAIKEFFETFCRDSAQKADREKLAKAGINAERLFSTFKSMCYKRNVDEWVYDKALAITPSGLSNTLLSIQKENILQTLYDCLKDEKQKTDKKGNVTTIPGFTDDEIDALGSSRGTDEVLKQPALDVARYVRRNGGNIDIKAIPIIRSLSDGKNSVASKVCISKNSKDKNYDAIMLSKAAESYKCIKDAMASDVVDYALETWDSYVHAICMELLVKAYEGYQKQRTSDGRINNDELLIKTRDMLLKSEKARDYFRQTYKYFYIDEYQDTDPVQTEILILLTATESTIGKKLETVDFMDGRFCLIGDPKQSIYAFRGADVELYARMRAAIEAKPNCKLYQMNRNYRSNEEICNWVNDKFKKKDESDFGFDSCANVVKMKSKQAGFDNMLSAKPAGDSTSFIKGVYKYYVPGGKKDDWIENDAEHVASMIKNMIDSMTRLSIYNTKTKTAEERVVEYGDFMILTRKKEGIRKYATALKNRGIPVLVNGASSISLGDNNDPEGSPLIGFRSLLTMSDFVAEADKKLRPYKLALVLEKVFCIAVSPTELFSYCDAIYGEKAEVVLSGITDISVKKALSMLSEVVRIARRNPLLAFERLSQSYEALLNTDNTYEDLLSETGALEQILEQIREARFGSFEELNEQLKLIVKGKNEKELPLGEDESKKAVHIMNAHLAKGLEANIVILACPAYKAPGFQDKVIVDGTMTSTGSKMSRGYVEVALDPVRAGRNKYPVSVGKSQGFDVAAGPKTALHCEEELRVLYVSGTRPKECLIIAEGKGDSAWKDLLSGITDIDTTAATTPEYQKMIAMGEAYVAPTPLSTKSIDLRNIDGQMTTFRADAVNKKHALEALKTISEVSVHPSDQELHNNVEAVDPSYMCGNLFGIMMHKFFELLVGAEWKKKKLYDEGKCSYGEVNSFAKNELNAMIRQAVMTGLKGERLSTKQCQRLKIDPTIATEEEGVQQKKLTEHLEPEFTKLAEALLKDAEIQGNIMSSQCLYTEMPFELNLDKSGVSMVENSIKVSFKAGQEVHIKGVMDLVLEQEDRFIIWDYKSDVIKVGESSTEMNVRLNSDYEAQLRIYKAALKSAVANDPTRNKKDVETKIYHRFR